NHRLALPFEQRYAAGRVVELDVETPVAVGVIVAADFDGNCGGQVAGRDRSRTEIGNVVVTAAAVAAADRGVGAVAVARRPGEAHCLFQGLGNGDRELSDRGRTGIAFGNADVVDAQRHHAFEALRIQIEATGHALLADLDERDRL